MDRDNVIDEVLRVLEKVLGSKTDPRMVEAIIQDVREELYAPRPTTQL